jgi:hypothetical protein
VVEEVAVAVRVEVCAVVLLNVSEEEESAQVAGLAALDIEVVTLQVSATVPEAEVEGVTVMVEVPVAAAPELRRMLPPLLREKLMLLESSQKSAHPARNGAVASNSHANFPNLISAPSALASSLAVLRAVF